MKPIRTPETNVTLTLPGGTDENDLPAARVLVYDSDAGETPEDARHAFETLWMPDEDEAARLEAGAAVRLRVVGQGHPPVALTVTEAIVPEREIISRAHVDRALGHLYAELNERVSLAILQLQSDDVPASQLVDTGGDVNPQAVGIPSAPAFADLWIAAVEATRDGTQNGNG